MGSINKKRVLMVENDKEQVKCIIDYFDTYVNEMTNYNIEVIPARTIDETMEIIGRARVQKPRKLFDAVLLDSMLPQNQEDLFKLESLEKKRKETWYEYIKIKEAPSESDNKKKIPKLKEDIDEIDDEIDKVLQLEGCIPIAEQYISTFPELSKTSNPFMFFTARSERDLMNRCGWIIPSTNFYWLEKPASPEDVFKIMLEFWKNSREDYLYND